MILMGEICPNFSHYEFYKDKRELIIDELSSYVQPVLITFTDLVSINHAY